MALGHFTRLKSRSYILCLIAYTQFFILPVIIGQNYSHCEPLKQLNKHPS